MANSEIEGGEVTKNLTYSEQDKMESTKELNRGLNRYQLEKAGSPVGFMKMIELDKQSRERVEDFPVVRNKKKGGRVYFSRDGLKEWIRTNEGKMI